ncbi:MAG: hypothetical protein K2Q18_03950, partial [Bdellovibrionales bacterium]|nr:hypothetical protein [Bdellovibrionales bacterium]
FVLSYLITPSSMTFIKILYNYSYMLEKLITNIKQSLPGGAGKANSVPNLGNDAQSALGNKKVTVQAAMAAAASGEEETKKRNGMIVKVIVICGLAYLAVDEFLLKEKSPVEATPISKSQKKSKKGENNPDSKDNAAVANTNVDAGKENAGDASGFGKANAAQDAISKNNEVAQEQTPPPIENINILNKDNTPINNPSPDSSSTRVGEVSMDQKLDQVVQNIDQNQNQNQNNTTVEEVKIPSQPQQQSQMVAGSKAEPQRDTSMASKIVEDATETAPPAYDQLGRGLVYNCKDKYWACLNKPAYLECNKNMKWNQSKGTPSECVVQDIYNSDEDCAKIQKYNVSVSTPTPFCN